MNTFIIAIYYDAVGLQDEYLGPFESEKAAYDYYARELLPDGMPTHTVDFIQLEATFEESDLLFNTVVNSLQLLSDKYGFEDCVDAVVYWLRDQPNPEEIFQMLGEKTHKELA